ncbi:MAG TPA: iron-containing alcohol dehydrogenase [Polyangiaceae bacterium]|nr:iron-containing alcohol dehydrogenase [Polyangiaceae bacterium]
MNFAFQSAGRIVFGPGRARELGREARALGARCLLVTGQSAERSAPAIEALREAGVAYEWVRVGGEPSIDAARSAAALGREMGAEFVVGFGGGSAIDLAKAAAALVPASGDALDYLEVIGAGKPLPTAALPSLVVPTTAGTGAEVTKNAVLSSAEHRVKVSLRHESMLPRVALVDPQLLLSCPADVTAATGLDALTQCLEPLVSVLHNPLADAVAEQGLRRGARSLERAVRHGDDLDARTDMALCSLCGGLALANAKLGAVHGFAAPLGGRFESPHGAVCARLLPVVFEVNLRALRDRAAGSPLLERFELVARILLGDPNARAERAAEYLSELAERLAIPRLSSYGMTSADIPELCDQAARASSMAGNPIRLEQAELHEILERCL